MHHLSGFLHSFVYSFRGIGFCIRRERNFRLYMLLFLYALLLALFFGFSPAEWAILAVAGTALLSAEALNTGIEYALDFAAKRKIHPMIRVAKDAASAGVFLPAMGALACAVFLFWKPEKWGAFLQSCIANPVYLIVILLALAFLVWFVFVFGKKKRLYHGDKSTDLPEQMGED